jgi:hypothetical protein
MVIPESVAIGSDPAVSIREAPTMVYGGASTAPASVGQSSISE